MISARLGELAERHGETRALLKKLWYVNGEGKRVQVWTLTGTGYALAEEKLARQLKVPRHDVAHQFLEHATGVNELYVALVKRAAASNAVKPDRRGKLADDFARLPTGFRWLPSEELELPFQEYVIEEGRRRDRRLQPDALLEDSSRRRRYLIEYETGSATVRNAQHKSATLTKLARYADFVFDYAEGDTTYYAKHFCDGLAPALLFLTRTTARRDTIREAVGEWARAGSSRMEVRAMTIAEACAEFRAQLVGDRPQASAGAPATNASPPPRDGAFISLNELNVLERFLYEAHGTIQRVRHSVRAGRPVTTEPHYPEQLQSAARILQRLRSSQPR